MLEIIVIIITTFGTLIYDEIIVIKKWGMDKNVAKEITSRGELELNSLGTFNDYDNEVETEEEETPKEWVYNLYILILKELIFIY